MKFRYVVLLVLFLNTTFCTRDKNSDNVVPDAPPVEDTVSVILKYDKEQPLESQYRISKVSVKQKGKLRFTNDTKEKETSVTFIIPNADLLFEDFRGYYAFSINNITYLVITVGKNGKSKVLKIHDDANQGAGEFGKRYVYSAYCQDAGVMAEGDSSPVIIIKPGS